MIVSLIFICSKSHTYYFDKRNECIELVAKKFADLINSMPAEHVKEKLLALK